eukprot:CAMPEP_0174720748 /NCGR_PEP_ID=MMETSP1094-20130205/34362_1 /TAXON_ID=156173 /ORGANISM="Chrysochromulina brevifilum, Strain UTEX LB 985" /LENGTH=145 /DNA_ID=CAMNT_0015921283 /DNA_START=1016 /DNA_END=1449 /DNA_ORIENTATION=-
MPLVLVCQMLAREEVAQMALALDTNELDPAVPVREVRLYKDRPGVASVKRGPATARAELGAGREERIVAAPADEVALGRVEFVILARALWLRRLFTQHAILLGSQLGPPVDDNVGEASQVTATACVVATAARGATARGTTACGAT